MIVQTFQSEKHFQTTSPHCTDSKYCCLFKATSMSEDFVLCNQCGDAPAVTMLKVRAIPLGTKKGNDHVR